MKQKIEGKRENNIITATQDEFNKRLSHLNEGMKRVGVGYVSVCGDIAFMKRTNAYLLAGYQNVYDMTKDLYGMARSTTSELISIFEAYGDDKTWRLRPEIAELKLGMKALTEKRKAEIGAKQTHNNKSKDAATDTKDAATDTKDAATDTKDAATDTKDAATDTKDAATTVKILPKEDKFARINSAVRNVYSTYKIDDNVRNVMAALISDLCDCNVLSIDHALKLGNNVLG